MQQIFTLEKLEPFLLKMYLNDYDLFSVLFTFYLFLEPHLLKVFTIHLMTSCLQKVSQVTCGGRMQCNRGDFCVLCKDSNWLDDYLVLLKVKSS